MFRYTKVYLWLDLRNTPTIYHTNTNRTFTKLIVLVVQPLQNRLGLYQEYESQPG